MSNTASDPETVESSPDPTPPGQPLNTYLPARIRILLGLSMTRQVDLEAGSHSAARDPGTATTAAALCQYLGYSARREGGMTCEAEQRAAEAQPPQPLPQAQPDPVLPLWWRRKPGESRR
ncbi:hypothetical protein NpNSSI1_00004216 [Neofusicoccum parvum]|nr:hypothetical protein NpNSSI1_00004216 [Neofusicoccum parvum]